MKRTTQEGSIAVIAVIGMFIGIFVLSFLITTFIYYLFTVIMLNFFNIIIPFSWTYAVGVWLIILLIRLLFGGGTSGQTK